MLSQSDVRLCFDESSSRRMEMQSENNLHHRKEFVGEGNFNFMHGVHFKEIADEDDAVEEENEEYGDLWSLCEPAKRPFESLLGNDGLSPVSDTQSHSSGEHLPMSSREFLCNNSLNLCTESLGFESSDERDDCYAGFPAKTENSIEGKLEVADDSSDAAEKSRYAPSHGHMGAKKGATFPPPLTWLKPSVFLKPLRKDGRFLLREVEAAPPPRHELLHAWREDGRLRLHLIPTLPHKDQNFIDTSVDGDTSSDEGQLNGPEDEPRLTSSSTSVDESSVTWAPGRWGATWENECVEFSRADVSLPVFLVSLDRCQENAACLPTWNPRCIIT